MNTFTLIKVGAKSDRGLVRGGNEDAYALSTNIVARTWQLPESSNTFQTSAKGALMVVADGMGGTRGGEIAAQLAIETIKTYFDDLPEITLKINFFKSHLNEAVLNAQQKIINHIKQNPVLKDMGTTVCLAWIFQNYVFTSWVGDSRVYLFRSGNGLIALTKDHSYVQELIDARRITEAEAFNHPDKNIITQSLGDVSRPPLPGFAFLPLQESDRILLCSDGLNTMITDQEIEGILSGYDPAAYTVGDLVERANKNGGVDNTTVIVCDILKLPSVGDQIHLQEVIETNPHQAVTNKPVQLKNNGIKKIFPLLIFAIVLATSTYFTYDYVFARPDKPVIMELKKEAPINHDDSTQQIKPAQTETSEISGESITTVSQNAQFEAFEAHEGEDDPVESSEKPKEDKTRKKADAKKEASVSPSKEKDQQTPLQKQEIGLIKMKIGKYYIIYDSFEVKENCEKEVRGIRKKSKPVFMGQCEKGGLFFALASSAGYTTQKEAEKIIKNESIRIVCN